MSRFLRILGFAWSLPVTLFGLLYVGVFSAPKWYKLVGVRGDTLVWRLNEEKAPEWLKKAWAKWGGHTVGAVVVLKNNPDTDNNAKITLRHEQEHARQCMILGPFWPIVYGLIMLVMKVCCRNADPYFSHPLEVDARRAAGQLIDVEGALKKVQDKTKSLAKN